MVTILSGPQSIISSPITVTSQEHYGVSSHHDSLFNNFSKLTMGWVGLWGYLWWAPSAKRKDHHGVSSGWSSVWHRSNTGLSITHKQQVLMHRHQGWNVRHGLCHIYMRYLYIYIWVVYSFCLFCCLFIIVTWWYMWCIVASKIK